MKILVHLPIGMHSPHLEVMLAESKNIAKEFINAKLYFTYCTGNNVGCIFNPLKLKSLCYSCKSKTENGLSLLGNYKNSIKESEKIKSARYDYFDMASFKSLEYEGYDIGYAALSTYISLTREVIIDFQSPSVRRVLDNLLDGAITSFKDFSRALQNTQPDLVLVHNGRLNTSKHVVYLCNLNNIDYRVIEYSIGTRRGVSFHNDIPHSINANVSKVNSVWDMADNIARVEVANDFFIKRRLSQSTNLASFTKQQTSGLLPDNWQTDSSNILILNSSEDEFMSVGGEWEDTFFDSQLHGIEFLCKTYLHSTHLKFWLRMHPNLSSAQPRYVEKFSNLENKYANLHIIPPTSAISTYALIDNSSKVVVFGSSTGVEAAYANKPVILLGRCFYESLGFVYRPTTTAELDTLITDEDLKAIYNENVLKIAFYWLKLGYEVDGISIVKDKYHIFGKAVKTNLLARGAYYLGKIHQLFWKKFIARE